MAPKIMLQSVKQAVGEMLLELWRQVAGAFIPSVVGALVIGSGALITGIIERIHQIDDLVKGMAVLEKRLDKRDEQIREMQTKSEKADRDLEVSVAGFKSEHGFIKEELLNLKQEIRRSASGRIRRDE